MDQPKKQTKKIIPPGGIYTIENCIQAIQLTILNNTIHEDKKGNKIESAEVRKKAVIEFLCSTALANAGIQPLILLANVNNYLSPDTKDSIIASLLSKGAIDETNISGYEGLVKASNNRLGICPPPQSFDDAIKKIRDNANLRNHNTEGNKLLFEEQLLLIKATDGYGTGNIDSLISQTIVEFITNGMLTSGAIALLMAQKENLHISDQIKTQLRQSGYWPQETNGEGQKDTTTLGGNNSATSIERYAILARDVANTQKDTEFKCKTIVESLIKGVTNRLITIEQANQILLETPNINYDTASGLLFASITNPDTKSLDENVKDPISKITTSDDINQAADAGLNSTDERQELKDDEKAKTKEDSAIVETIVETNDRTQKELTENPEDINAENNGTILKVIEDAVSSTAVIVNTIKELNEIINQKEAEEQMEKKYNPNGTQS